MSKSNPFDIFNFNCCSTTQNQSSSANGLFGGLFDICGPSKMASMEPAVNVLSEEDLKLRQLTDDGKHESAAAFSEDALEPGILKRKSVSSRPLSEDSLMSVSKNLQPRLAGIGIAFETRGDTSGLLVHSFKPGGAAEPLGTQGVIRAGDELISVDGIDIRGKRGKEIAGLLIGEDGSRVRVTFLRYLGSSRDKSQACEVSVDITRRATAAAENRAASIPKQWSAAGPV
jgi:C-terminal processing protease CtpA/Prc